MSGYTATPNEKHVSEFIERDPLVWTCTFCKQRFTKADQSLEIEIHKVYHALLQIGFILKDGKGN